MKSKIYVVAEIGINANGSMEIAKQLIRKAHEAGCDAVKFQKRDIESVYTKEELDTLRESPWGTTTRQQKEGLEFSAEQYRELCGYTKSLGLGFGVSCWDEKSVDLIEQTISVDFHKVASALMTHRDFLEKLNQTKKPVILSTGMCTQSMVDKAVDRVNQIEYILACTSTYPTKPEEANLKYITTLQKKFPSHKIGFSNHYNGHEACIMAATLGAACIEFHITLDRTMYGSDQAASIENAKTLVDGIRKAEILLGDGVKKVYTSEEPISKKLRKVVSLV